MAEGKEKETKKDRIPSAVKRDLQNKRNRNRNRIVKAKVKTAMRSFEESLEKEGKEAAKIKLSALFSLLDKGVKTNRFTQNKANRTKTRLAARLR